MLSKRFGFSLSEILVSLSILALIAVLTIPAVLVSGNKHADTTRSLTIQKDIQDVVRLSDASLGSLPNSYGLSKAIASNSNFSQTTGGSAATCPGTTGSATDSYTAPGGAVIACVGKTWYSDVSQKFTGGAAPANLSQYANKGGDLVYVEPGGKASDTSNYWLYVPKTGPTVAMGYTGQAQKFTQPTSIVGSTTTTTTTVPGNTVTNPVTPPTVVTTPTNPQTCTGPKGSTYQVPGTCPANTNAGSTFTTYTWNSDTCSYNGGVLTNTCSCQLPAQGGSYQSNYQSCGAGYSGNIYTQNNWNWGTCSYNSSQVRNCTCVGPQGNAFNVGGTCPGNTNSGSTYTTYYWSTSSCSYYPASTYNSCSCQMPASGGSYQSNQSSCGLDYTGQNYLQNNWNWGSCHYDQSWQSSCHADPVLSMFLLASWNPNSPQIGGIARAEGANDGGAQTMLSNFRNFFSNPNAWYGAGSVWHSRAAWGTAQMFDANGNQIDVGVGDFINNLQINGVSAIAQGVNSYDALWNYGRGTATSGNSLNMTVNLWGTTYAINTGYFSPIKISLSPGQIASLNSSDHFAYALNGFEGKTAMVVMGQHSDALEPSVIRTTGGLNAGEAWLAMDRNHDGFFQNGVLDGRDVFGDHQGQFANGYQDLATQFNTQLKSDAGGQYVSLHPLTTLQKQYDSLLEALNIPVNDPSYTLKLITQDHHVLFASDVLSQVYVSSRTVHEADATGSNEIRQRAKVVYTGGQTSTSADQWFKAS